MISLFSKPIVKINNRPLNEYQYSIKIYPFIIILFFPQIGLCWDVVQYQRDGIDYVSAVEEYNGGYKLVLEKPCAGFNPDFALLYSPTWEIQAKSNIKKWIELSSSGFLTYDLYIDSNPSNSDQSIKLTYDIGTNTATIKGDLSQSLLIGFERGNSASVKYQTFLDSSNTLVSLSLKGSRNAIQEANRQCNVLGEEYDRLVKEQEQKKLIYFGIASFIALIIAFMVLRWAFKKTKLVAKKVSNKSQEISIIVQNKVDEARKNRVYNKISESALDEIVREAVRQAMREGIRPDDICPKCLGEGCDQCDGKGWSSNSIS